MSTSGAMFVCCVRKVNEKKEQRTVVILRNHVKLELLDVLLLYTTNATTYIVQLEVMRNHYGTASHSQPGFGLNGRTDGYE